jgi:hypothetical protein
MTDERLFEKAHKIPPLIHGLEEDFFSKEVEALCETASDSAVLK